MNSETNNRRRTPVVENHSRNRRPNRGNRRKKRRAVLGVIVAAAVVLIALLILAIVRYTPTRERMELTEYFHLTSGETADIILDSVYDEEADPAGLIRDGQSYVSITFAKEKLDDGYVFDSVENTLRYTTDSQLITAYVDSANYLVDREQKTFDAAIVVLVDGTAYLNLDWMKNYTDFTYYSVSDPNRIVMETAGWEHEIATVKRKGAYRRFAGPKSKILDDAEKGDVVIVLEDYGKWSLVLNERGVLGCIENKRLKGNETVATEVTLPERSYSHTTFNNGSINLGWHQVTNYTANGTLDSVLSNTSGMNVISPTWWGLSDNVGNISDISDASYVATCHAQGIQVWGLVSNFVHSDINTTAVLNTTSSRDTLVNNLIAAAITSNVDGINVDFESLSIDAKDGYIQFIRELSLKCRNNNLILSVDNYKPTAYTEFYNRAEQAKYADYIILMGYDEHYAGSAESGSVASLPFVQEGITDTLAEVPREQLVLGMPFYTRIWKTDENGLTSEARGMQSAQEFIERNEVEMVWDESLSQYYGEFTESGVYYQIWMEDAQSLSAKLSLMKSENLAGGAFWKLGFEPYSIWDTINTYMN